ncbi:MAG: HDIG domain-containing metalloprotein [Balneolaceae bacterium]
MRILEKLGLGQKKRKGVPNIGEKKKKDRQEVARKKNKYLRAAVFVSFLLLVLITLPQSTFQPVASYTIGEPWRYDDLTAPFAFSLQKTQAEIEEEREEIRQQTPPVFHVNPNAAITIEARLDSLYRNMQPVFDSYLQWQQSKRENGSSAANDSIRFQQERSFSNVELDDTLWNALLENYAAIRLSNQPERRTVTAQIRNQLNTLITEILNDGVIDQDKEELESDEITVRNLRQRTERSIRLSNTRDLNEAREYARFQLSRNFMPQIADAAVQVFNQIIQPNWIYNERDTEALLEQNLSTISSSKGAVTQGQVIIRRGDIVDVEQANMLRSLAEARATSATEVERWFRYGGEVIVIIAITLVFLFYIYLYRRPIFDKPAMFLLVFLVLAIIVVASNALYQFENVNSYIVPIAVAPIILTIIFDSRVGLMATITLAMITAFIHDSSFEFLVATTTACSLGVFSVRDIKKRSQFFFTTPGIVFATYVLVIGGFALARFSGWEKFLNDSMFVAINAVFILFTYPLILLFEKVFKITTDFTLLELADTNLPLLKELMNHAPGTFHHSLQVANLAESAASSIGANGLLCRVGALYHDIGKMEKPGYFIENQSRENDHDKLKPRMSALVIKAHVSDGIKKAKKNNLPEVVIDFIRTHHGTSLIRYFYQKAEDQSQEVQEEDFRYDGPVPFTPEQGILLLADTVEAASRAMKEPSYNKLESLITRLTDEHISEGQLSNCPLTFRQIQNIKESFLTILVGVYHSRIEYPEDEKEKKKSHKNEPLHEDGAGAIEQSKDS